MYEGLIPKQCIPEQNSELIHILMGRFLRAAEPHRIWAAQGKLCQDFFEGRQWTDEQKAILKASNRPILVLNKIARLMRLVSGYQRNNRTDINFIPTSDSASSDDTADILEMIVKSESQRNMLQFTDSDVFYDAIITGRGYWDFRLSFENNDFGETKITHGDPFSTYIDPDCLDYDLNASAAYIQESKWASVDEVEFNYGRPVADMVRSRAYFGNNNYLSSQFDLEDEVSPIRSFAMVANSQGMSVSDAYHLEFVDTYQKRLRLLDTQYAVTNWCRHFVDLETGDSKPIPENWDDERIKKCLLYAQSLKQELIVDWRKRRRIRWTVMCGDIILHDAWSPYDTYTKIPFFPYFRRGVTKGLVDDLIDPQVELNKRRMSTTEILTRSASVGWKYHEGSMDAKEEANLKRSGARPGFHLKWKGDKEPQQIQPSNYPQGHERLEDKAREDLNEISGINESALGEIDKVQSGRAIEARQRQAVVSIQPYLDNFSRSKVLHGRKFLELIQNHYTEPRVFRILGDDSQMVKFEINKMIEAVQNGERPANGVSQVLNDVTVGKYEVTTTDRPLDATFKNAQFEEALMVLGKLGPVAEILLGTAPELLINMSSLPHKEKWIAALEMAAQKMQAQQAATTGGAPGAVPQLGTGAPSPQPPAPGQQPPEMMPP